MEETSSYMMWKPKVLGENLGSLASEMTNFLTLVYAKVGFKPRY